MPSPSESPVRQPTVQPETTALRELQGALGEAELALARRMHMNPTDLSAMGHLAFADGSLGTGELTGRLGISPAATTELVDRLERAGCARYVVTDVNKDGMLAGPNVGLLRSVLERTDKPVVASGGISSLDDLRALRELTDAGLEGAIVGTALYEGSFTLVEALAVAEQ